MAPKTLTRHGNEEINQRLPRPSLHKDGILVQFIKIFRKFRRVFPGLAQEPSWLKKRDILGITS
jgi:hypothetical protein